MQKATLVVYRGLQTSCSCPTSEGQDDGVMAFNSILIPFP